MGLSMSCNNFPYAITLQILNIFPLMLSPVGLQFLASYFHPRFDHAVTSTLRSFSYTSEVPCHGARPVVSKYLLCRLICTGRLLHVQGSGAKLRTVQAFTLDVAVSTFRYSMLHAALYDLRTKARVYSWMSTSCSCRLSNFVHGSFPIKYLSAKLLNISPVALVAVESAKSDLHVVTPHLRCVTGGWGD